MLNMSGLVPFNKRRDLLNTNFGDFSNMVDDFFSEGFPFGRNLEKDTFKLDVQEKENEYLVEAELPGVKKEEINLELNQGRLTITVKKEEKVEEEKKNYIHRERRSSSMSRSVYLSDTKTEGVKAALNEGVLTITVPKEPKQNMSNKINID